MRTGRAWRCVLSLFAASVGWAAPQSRIAGKIDDRRTVAHPLDVHPLARAEFDAGEVPSLTRMERMVLLLARDPAQQKELDQLLAAQQDRQSPVYRHWITPEAFGKRFGLSDDDLRCVVDWLRSHGFAVEPVAAARQTIVFSGTAAQVSAAFHTPMHFYGVNGQRHYANAAAPRFPEALGGVVRGIVSLHDFHSKPMHYPAVRIAGAAAPLISDSSGNHYLSPADFAAIYDLAPLAGSIDGTGQSIAVVARTNISLPDVEMFRSGFGLPFNDPAIILNGPDPGIVSENEEGEAVLDVEWSGAVGSGAAVQFVVSASTNTTDGVDLSAQYIVDNNLASVVTTSFGSCENQMGSTENQFWDGLWQQAAAQGITALVASGDSGVAGCDSDSTATATHPQGVNGLCSSPSSTCVGGTEFADAANPAAYWTPSGAAIGYIPEGAWNESGTVAGGGGLWSTGGGASMTYPKPGWQTGLGVPADGWRDVPDVALTAAVHDGYVIYMEGGYWTVGGTSAASPSFAGLVALAAQQTGSRLGTANPTLYVLAANQGAGGAAVFHDVTTGNNSVPGLTGYSAGAGYDLATGLGSVDAAQLVSHWNDASSASGSFQLSPTPASVSIVQGTAATVDLSLTASGGFNADVALVVSGGPSGVVASLAPTTIVAGSSASTLTLTADALAATGAGVLTIAASGGGVTRYLPVPVTVVSACSYSISPGSAAVAATSGTGAINVTTTNVTTQAACPWTAVSNSFWITITSGAAGVGSQSLSYSVGANPAGYARTGSLTVAGFTFTVTQAAPPWFHP